MITRQPLPDGVTECSINRCGTLAVSRVGVTPYCKTHAHFARKREAARGGTTNRTDNAHRPTDYDPETVRLVVRHWAAMRRAGDTIPAVELAGALDQLYAEYRS